MSNTQKFERFSTIFLFAGLLMLIIAFLVLGLAPATMVMPDKTQGLPAVIPDDFIVYYASVEAYQQGLVHGRDIYIKEACWHCHSQYVRPVSNESLRYGPVSQPGEYQNILNLPQLFGTRRVGPDLSRESGKRPNDWHFAHLFNPKSVEPQSIMPVFPWYFDMQHKDGTPATFSEAISNEDVTVKPKQGAIDLVAYLQWLGSDVATLGTVQYDASSITMPPAR